MAYDKIVAADDASYQLPPLVRDRIEANIRDASTGEGDAVRDVADSRITVARQNGILSPNYVINGGMDIWQRGTSSGWANSYTTADRWFTNASASTSWAQDSTNVAGGCRFSIRATVGSGAPADPIILQAIETSNSLPLVGKTVTLSAFVSTSSSSNVRLTIESSTNTDNALTGSWTNVNTQTFASTTTLTRYSMTTSIPSNVRSIRVVVGTNGTIPANATMNITGVQLEEGVTASPFRRNANSIQGELAACQRYYQSSYNIGSGPGTITDIGSIYFDNVGGGTRVDIRFATTMRINPVVTFYNPATGTINQCRSISSGTNHATAPPISAGNTGVGFDSGVIASPQFGHVHYTADSEL